MTLAEWNNKQIQEAFKLSNRQDYFDATDNLLPSASQLVLFYIENNATQFEEEHERDEL